MDSLAGLRTAVYARFSSDNQRDTSIDDQVRLARQYVGARTGSISSDLLLTDYAVSGVSRAREGFDRLLHLIEGRSVDLVVTESASRLTRDLGDADRLWKLCEFHGVRLICISEGVDSARDGARMQFQMHAVMSDQYLVKLGKETLRGLRGAAERGHSTGGLPYGYSSRPIWNGGREPEAYEIIIDDAEAEVVRAIFEMYRDGHSYLTIASKLNDRGVRPPRADSKRRATKFWRKGTVREMLRNKAYAGTWTFGKKQWRKDPITRKRRWSKRTEGVQSNERPHLQIVSPALWEAVRARREAVRENYAGKGTGAPGRRTSRPFTGLLYCGVCGNRMVDSGGSSARYYRCSGAVAGGICGNTRPLREDVLIAVAVAELKRVLLTPELGDIIREKVEGRLVRLKSEARKEEKALVVEMARVDADVQRLLNCNRSGGGLSRCVGACE